jgi:Asp-tRNA(Asn)/Glu-tRNA(Gln) amidotransferase A subunit family amidase
MLIGKTHMHEIGLLPDSVNPHWGTARNPFNIRHDAGGSSSGSAAAVAAGFCPVAVGADGGGSIRIPAAFCDRIHQSRILHVSRNGPQMRDTPT